MKKLVRTIACIALLFSLAPTPIQAYYYPRDLIRSTIEDKVEAYRAWGESLRSQSLPYSPTPSPSEAVTKESSPTASPKPTPTPLPAEAKTLEETPTPTPTSAPQPDDSIKGYIMAEINKYRDSLGLPSVSTDPYTCAFAKTRANEISSNFSHDGFENRINSKSLPYPGYQTVSENLAKVGNYKQVVSLWIGSSGHEANLRADTPFVCVERVGSFYAYEGWKP